MLNLLRRRPHGLVRCLRHFPFPLAVDEAGVLVCCTASKDSQVLGKGVLMMA